MALVAIITLTLVSVVGMARIQSADCTKAYKLFTLVIMTCKVSNFKLYSVSYAGVFESTVRPLPNTSHRGMFAMCNGMWCNGDVNCTFAHNQKELETWNRERSAKRRRKFTSL